jgi:hypothetical protein
MFWQICLFRRGPQDVPQSHVLLALGLAANILLGGIAQLTVPNQDGLLILTLIDAVAVALFLYGALAWRGLTARFIKAYSAINGAGFIITLIALPVSAWLAVYSDGDPDAAVPLSLLLVVRMWSIAVFCHILRETLEISWTSVVLLGFGYVFAFEALVSQIPGLSG